MADSETERNMSFSAATETEQVSSKTPVADSESEQVTSKTPVVKQKNPKRVAVGKAIAQRTKKAREAQKKSLIEAQSIIANNQAPAVDESAKITTTQWLSVISIVVSLAGIYYKREEIKGLLTPKKPRVNTPPRGITPMD